MAEILLVCGSPGLSQLFWTDEWSVLTRRSQFLLKVVAGNGFSCTQTIKTEMFPQSKISCEVLFLEGWNGHLVSKNYVFGKKIFCLPTVDWNSQRHFLFFFSPTIVTFYLFLFLSRDYVLPFVLLTLACCLKTLPHPCLSLQSSIFSIFLPQATLLWCKYIFNIFILKIPWI